MPTITSIVKYPSTHTCTTVIWPFFQDHPGEPVSEEIFWTIVVQGKITEAQTDHPDGHHSIWTNQRTTSIILPFLR